MDDVALPQHHRSGAHRVRRHPLMVAVLTLGAVAAVSALLLWALLRLDVLGVGDGLREAGGGAPAAPAPASPAPSGEPSAAASAPTPDAPSGAPSVEAAAPAGDRSLSLAVLNATTTSGLATATGEVLSAAGWTVAEVGNYGSALPTSTVLHPEDDQAAAAAAALVAADLGVGEAEPSPDVDVVTVVVGEDLEP